MATTQTLEQPMQSTCAKCPYFQDFDEALGRGWCRMFDQMARQHHNRTVGCEQEISAVESAQQEPVTVLKSKSPSAGLAGDEVSCQLLEPIEAPHQLESEQQPTPKASTEFEQGMKHGKNDAESGWHPIYAQASTDYAIGYLSGYNETLNPAPEHPKANLSLEWSVYLDPRCGLYQVWVGSSCIGHGATSEEAERKAQRYIAADELIRRQPRGRGAFLQGENPVLKSRGLK